MLNLATLRQHNQPYIFLQINKYIYICSQLLSPGICVPYYQRKPNRFLNRPQSHQCSTSAWSQIIKSWFWMVLAWRNPKFGCFNFRTSVLSTYIILLRIFRIRIFFTVASINSTERSSFWSRFSNKGSICCQGCHKYLPSEFGKSHLSLCLHLSMDKDCGSLWLTIE